MKIAYRIVTPILALGSVAMGLLLNLFGFTINGASEEISKIVALAQQFGVKTTYEYSAFDIIKMLLNADGSSGDTTLTSIAGSVMPYIIAFVVFFVLSLVMFLAVGTVAAATCNRKAVICMSGSGLVLCFVGIVIAKVAFDKIVGGEIELSEVVGAFSDSKWAQLLSTVVVISNAVLSTGFYAVFGMYIVVILWSILVNMLIKTPITFEKKHRRKKPLPRPSAIFKR